MRRGRAAEHGRWAISESAHGSWDRLNPFLSNDVRSLLIADLNENNVDDLILLKSVDCDTFVMFWIRCKGVGKVTWWISDDGRSRWRELTTQWLAGPPVNPALLAPVFGYAGRFGAAPGGGVLLIDRNRFGRFFSEAEIAAGASPDWASLFAY